MFSNMQGTSTNVPRYLRAEGQINNKKMSRQELEELVVGFWEFRTVQIAERGGGGGKENALDELLYSYLLQRNDGQEQAAIEDGYNLQVCVCVCVCVHVCVLECVNIVMGKNLWMFFHHLCRMHAAGSVIKFISGSSRRY